MQCQNEGVHCCGKLARSDRQTKRQRHFNACTGRSGSTVPVSLAAADCCPDALLPRPGSGVSMSTRVAPLADSVANQLAVEAPGEGGGIHERCCRQHKLRVR
ncbi:hypothetical protein F443_05214 [Phytophthora nicotianae P1569]|uniref:Uncharacterized protein n=1 Tax=Phytophthora nicotianae P1569 TaxID=1317065 RepID=V9FK19_PHYNI|nr:hypothetical protein F443_05214 [Phytophthora nicotianae P1569]